ncbi:MAG: CoA transferase [Betaproteobacteria bacterium]|nr:MAG: CoA transferase [Betaproteobacteria bacterium]
MAATLPPAQGGTGQGEAPRAHALPLAGIRVIEFAHMVMGPACGLVLADLGAEVIKIEPVEGDNTRRLSGTGAGFWVTYNRNKKSLALDLKSPAGLKIALQLLLTADVITENFRSGALEKLGLGYEAVRQLRPEIIYCSLKGFLPGPYAGRTALDEVVQMMGGLAYMTGPEGRPLRAGASVNDIMGGMFGAIAILAALHERSSTGRGQLVQSALFENNVFLVAQHMMQYAVTGKPAAPMPSRLSAWAIYDVFDTADGSQLFVGVVSDTQWKAFCERFDMAELAADATLATNNQRVHARERLLPPVRARFAQMRKAELMQACERAGLPYAPIVKPQELFEDPHLNASGGFAEITLEDGRAGRVPKLPLEMDGRRFGAELDVPAAGSHTRELLAELGYAEAEVEQLAATGTIGAPT